MTRLKVPETTGNFGWQSDTYLRMYGNGNFHLPIIDIVQTINSASHACKSSKFSKPLITSSSKGFFCLRRELDWEKRAQKQLPMLCEKKSVSYDYLPKEVFPRDEDDSKSCKRFTPSKTKILKFRKNGPSNASKFLSCCCDKDPEGIGEKKSLKVLFRATKTSSLFDKDGLDDDDFNVFFLKSPGISSADLKRKGSFADYIRMKRRKKNRPAINSESDLDQKNWDKNYLFHM